MMKHTLLLSAFVGLTLSAASCRQEPLETPSSEGGRITFEIASDLEDAPTKAISAYTTMLDAEKKIKHIQLLIYDSKGVLEQYLGNADFTYDGGGTETTTKVTATTPTLTTGTKTVMAILNCSSIDFSTCSTLSSAQSKTADTPDAFNNKSDCFLQFATASVVVEANQTVSANLKAQRRVARVTLAKLTNNLSNSMNITKAYVYLSNGGATSVNVVTGEGSGNLVNKDGRNGNSVVNGGTVMSEQAICAVSSSAINHTKSVTNLIMYGNPSTESGAAPRLTVAATIGGKIYFYSVTLDKFVANTTYTVALTLNHLGTSDPKYDNAFGQMDVTVTTDAWATGSNVEQEI